MRLRPSSQYLLVGLFAVAVLAGCNRAKTDQANQAKTPSTASDKADASGAQTAALTITTTSVSSEQLVRTIPATGSIYPWQEVIIGAEVGGYRVAEVLVDVGTHVKKDQPLVKLSSDLLEADLASRRAAMRSAQANESNAAAALKRGQSVVKSGALSAADLDKLNAEQVAAQAQVDTATTDVATSELRLRYATVRAPDAGTVTSRTVSVGQIAQAGSEMLRMLRQDRIEWRAEVPESQLALIKAGQSVEVTAADGSVLKGRVRTVAPTIQTINRTGLVYVDITGGTARAGMFARGQIAAGSGPGLLVPVASVVVQDGYSYVFVLKGKSTVERRRVQQAGVHGDSLEIADGLVAGDVVAVKGAGFLKDGDTVAVASEVAAK
ncbi:MAG: efflux RND transporter periplasmic adaptor subunit [Pseudomonadota bacterium]